MFRFRYSYSYSSFKDTLKTELPRASESANVASLLPEPEAGGSISYRWFIALGVLIVLPAVLVFIFPRKSHSETGFEIVE
jgi:hypothetical protein